MGNRQSSTEDLNEIPTVLEEEDVNKDVGDEDDSYGVKQYHGETSEKKIPTLNLLDDNTDESNNTQSESTASNQSCNRSYGSSTTRTKYGETNSVVTSDYDSEGSWSDVGETSKSNTVSKESMLYDTDDQTALTDLAHYGDDEDTKSAHRNSKKKRRTKWLKMINAQEQVLVQSNLDDDEVETVLEFDDDRSLRSMFRTIQSKGNTDGDEETTIMIIDADEEYSRCSFNEASYHRAHDVVLSTISNHSPNSNIESRDKQTVITDAVATSKTVLVGHAVNIEHNEKCPTNIIVASKEVVVSPITRPADTSLAAENEISGDGITKDRENENSRVEETKEMIVFVDGLVGDPVEANVSRQSMISPHADESQQGNILLKESLSSVHNNFKIDSPSSTSFLNVTPVSKKSDPSGIIVMGADVPEKNKRKVPRKLLDDVELNPKRVEMQRNLLMGANIFNSLTQKTHSIPPGSISMPEKTMAQSARMTTKTIQITSGQADGAQNHKPEERSIPPFTSDKNMSKQHLNSIEQTIPVVSDDVVTKQQQPIEHLTPVSPDKVVITKHLIPAERTIPVTSDKLLVKQHTGNKKPRPDSAVTTNHKNNQEIIVDTLIASPKQKDIKAMLPTDGHNIVNKGAKKRIGKNDGNLQTSIMKDTNLLVVQSHDVLFPTSSIHQPDMDVIVDESNKYYGNSNSIFALRSECEIDVNTSVQTHNAAKPSPESSQLIKRVESHRKNPKTDLTAKQTVKDVIITKNEHNTTKHITNIEMDTKKNVTNMKNLPIDDTVDTNFPLDSELKPSKHKVDGEFGKMLENTEVPNDNVHHLRKQIVTTANSDINSQSIKVEPNKSMQYATNDIPTRVQADSEKQNIGRDNRRQQSTPKIMIRPEICYIETATSHDKTEESFHAVEPKKKTKPLSPKPENDEYHARNSVSRQSTNVSSVVEVIDEDDNIDFEVAKQYDETFNVLLQRNPQFIAQNPSLMEIIRVAKLQKILSATLEMERELEDYVQSLRDQKIEVSAHYQQKLLEASRRNAEREYLLQGELDALKSSVMAQESKNQWDILSRYKDYCVQYQRMQLNLMSQKLSKVDDPLSTLPECLAAEKKLLVDALTSAHDDDDDHKNMGTIRNENITMRQEVKELENELHLLKQSSEANRYAWVDSVLCNMDSRQFDYLKQLRETKHTKKK